MANTAASQLGSRICLNPADSESESTWGKLADAYKPGDVVYESAKGTWTKQATNAGQYQRSGVVGDKARVGSDWARKDIDDAFTTTDLVEIWLKGRLITSIVDQTGAKIRGQYFTLSSTAGSLTSSADLKDTRFDLAQDDVASGDTYAIMNKRV